MALSLLPQPKSIKVLGGNFDFKEVDTILLAKRATSHCKKTAELLASELNANNHLDYQIKSSPNVKDPNGCLITHHTRGGIFIKTTLKRPQAYELLAAGHSLTVSATDAQGFMSATRTIRQLLLEGTLIPALKIQDWPTVPFRALHLDLRGLCPNLQALKECVDRASLYKFSSLLVEYEDRFPFECLPEPHGVNALTKETLKEFLAYAERQGLTVIPLLRVLGDWDFLLRRSSHKTLAAEDATNGRRLDFGNPKVQKLIKEMLKELTLAHKASPSVHLGGACVCGGESQEVSRGAASPKAGQPTKEDVEPLLKAIRQVKAAGKDSLIWDDVLRDLPSDLMKKFPKATGVIYRCDDPMDGHFRPESLPHLDRYRSMGFPIYGGFAIRGAGAFYSNVPEYRGRMANVDWWVEAAETQGSFVGLIATARARFNPLLTPCDPLPTLWPIAIYAAERMWAGLGSSRESFERRLLVGFYGLRPEMKEVAQAHYAIEGEGAAKAREVFRHAKRSARRNRDVLELLELFADLSTLAKERRAHVERVGGMLLQLEAGCADPSQVRELKAKIPGLTRQIEHLHRDLSRVLLKRFHKSEVEEFIQNRLLICERFLGQLQVLLKRN